MTIRRRDLCCENVFGSFVESCILPGEDTVQRTTFQMEPTDFTSKVAYIKVAKKIAVKSVYSRLRRLRLRNSSDLSRRRTRKIMFIVLRLRTVSRFICYSACQQPEGDRQGGHSFIEPV